MKLRAGVLLLSLAHTSAFNLPAALPCIRTCFGSLPLRAAQTAGPRMAAGHPDATPGSSPMNFAAVSARDQNVFGIHRPGFLPDGVNEKPGAVEDALVSEWCAFVKGKGVTRIVSFLEDDEADWYKTPIDKQLEAEGFSEGKGTYLRVPLSSSDGAKKGVDALLAATAAGDKVVLHCSGGVGRTGLMSAVYLVKQYGLSPEDAVKEVTDQAVKENVARAAKVQKVVDTIAKI